MISGTYNLVGGWGFLNGVQPMCQRIHETLLNYYKQLPIRYLSDEIIVIEW